MTAGVEKDSPPSLSVQIPSPSPKMKDVSRKRPRMARLVSQEELPPISMGTSESVERVSSPRCVSERDNVACSITSSPLSQQVPPLPNPLGFPCLFEAQVTALRLEAELHPMRLIVARLMAHPTFNRKGLFNRPVDPVALGLPDYHLIVEKPMDLGTVKARVHAVAYQSREEAADEIRLVFRNAMKYNPPHNEVHKCARELLSTFETAYGDLDAVAAPEDSTETTVDVGTTECEAATHIPVSVSAGAEGAGCCTPSVDRASDNSLSKAENSLLSVPSIAAEASDMGSNGPAASSITQTPVNTLGTRACNPNPLPVPVAKPRRRSSLQLPVAHSCQSCEGRKCSMCLQGCLSYEPTLLVCQGIGCAGAKIRKGVAYYTTKDGTRQFCHKCYANLAPVLPHSTDQDPRYKQDLLKRFSNEEIVEDWLTCSKCNTGVHHVCAMHNGYVHEADNYVCPGCKQPNLDSVPTAASNSSDRGNYTYTFVSGSDVPVATATAVPGAAKLRGAETLKECAVSNFIQAKVRSCMSDIPNSDKTVTVRVISDCDRNFHVPDVIRRHFRMASAPDKSVKPPSLVNYRQKAIALFQKIDGLDVCIFCMYVQEYDGKDEFEEPDEAEDNEPFRKKRVYIAYLDSVEHFRPRSCRTQVFQEMLVSYLATARERGYSSAHIWACPPSRGNSFVFWNHPASQRTPTKERLVSWYQSALSRAVECGVVTDVKSLFESHFENQISDMVDERGSEFANSRMLCPPLFDGDFWIEEAVRIHSASMARHLKTRSSSEVCVWNVSSPPSVTLDPCPAMQIASLLHDRIMTHPSSAPFRRPVNAAAMKLKDYHKIVPKPMDLGTIYSRCILGEYAILRDVVSDVELMVSNAKRFNPVGHPVHTSADDVFDLFFKELGELTSLWNPSGNSAEQSWESHSDVRMSLNTVIEIPGSSVATNEAACVVIEDDRSSDGSRSLESTSSFPGSPSSARSSIKDDDSIPSAPTIASSTSRPVSRKAGRKPKKRSSVEKLDLMTGGPEAVFHSMVGGDTWLLDKRIAPPPKPRGQGKKSGAKRRRSSLGLTFDEPAKRRKQSWLGEEVGDSVRRLRTYIFNCSLETPAMMSTAQREKLESYRSYADCFSNESDVGFSVGSHIADARSTLLEFSQFRHFEFDTLRRAKYSTAMLLYHLHHGEAPGIIPRCTTCNCEVEDVRWHKVRKAGERRRSSPKVAPVHNASKPADDAEWQPEELCSPCHSELANGEDFIPIPVSVRPRITG